MKSLFRFLLVVGTTLLASSCFQHSVVVRVNADKSGTITSRSYFSPMMANTLKAIAAQGKGDSNPLEGINLGDIDVESIFNPTKEQLEEDAKDYGDGISYAQHKAGTNSLGWNGYVIVYQFKDINQLSINPGYPAGPVRGLLALSPIGNTTLEGTGDKGNFTFSMENDELTILTRNQDSRPIETPGKHIVDADDDSIPKDTEPSPEILKQIPLMTPMVKGARLGTFLFVAPGIAETDASHVTDSMITLGDVDFAKAIANPEFAKIVQENAYKSTPDLTVKDANAMITEMDGFTIERKAKIKIKLKR